MDSIVRISSVQGNHDFSGNKNNVDFNLDSGSGIYDLSESYVAINMRVDANNNVALTTTGATGDGSSIFNTFLAFKEIGADTRSTNDSNVFITPPTTAVLVKNAQMVCSKGQVETLTRVDRLRANEYAVLKAKQSLESQSNSFVLPVSRKSGSGGCIQPFNELVSITDPVYPVESQVRNHEIRIPLKEILNVGNQKMYDTTKYLNTRLHLELNLQKLAADLIGNKVETNRFLGLAGLPFQGQMRLCKNDTAANVTLSTALTENFYGDYGSETIPFWVGQKVLLATNTGGDPAVTGQVTTIKKIHIYDGVSDLAPFTFGFGYAIAQNKGRAILEFDGSYVVVAPTKTVGPNGSELLVKQTLGGATTLTQTLNKIELVCKRSQSGTSPAKLEYTKFISEEDTFPAAADTVLQRYYSIPPNCDAIIITMIGKNGIYTTADGDEDVEEYRVTINGEDLSNRPIKMQGQMHNNLISQTINNLGHQQQSNLNEFVSFNWSDGNSTSLHKANTIMIPVPLSNSPGQLGIEVVPVSGKTFGGQLSIYKHVMAEI